MYIWENELSWQRKSKIAATHFEDMAFGRVSVPSQAKINHSSFAASQQWRILMWNKKSKSMIKNQQLGVVTTKSKSRISQTQSYKISELENSWITLHAKLM